MFDGISFVMTEALQRVCSCPQMDKYLQPQFQPSSEHKFGQDGYLTMEQAPPYSINMNVFLPDVTYLRTGLCRPVRPATPQMKPEPLQPLSYPSCHHTPAPEYTQFFSPANGTGSNTFIKQETPPIDFQDVPLFQLLNSDLDPSGVSGTHSFIEPHGGVCSSVSSYSNVHSSANQIPGRPLCDLGSNGPSCSGHFGQHHQQKAAYLPPSPPNSEPGSPDRRKELIHNLSPPPSYAASIASKLAGPALGPGAAAMAVQTQQVPARYNRRSNPDLDKRRIHHCDVPGEPWKAVRQKSAEKVFSLSASVKPGTASRSVALGGRLYLSRHSARSKKNVKTFSTLKPKVSKCPWKNRKHTFLQFMLQSFTSWQWTCRNNLLWINCVYGVTRSYKECLSLDFFFTKQPINIFQF